MILSGSIAALLWHCTMRNQSPLAERMLRCSVAILFSIGALSYLFGACLNAYGWYKSGSTNIAGIFFAEQSFVAFVTVIADFEIMTKRTATFLDDQKCRVAVFHVPFIALSLIAMASYFSFGLDTDGYGGVIVVAIIYIFVLVMVIAHLAVSIIPEFRKTEKLFKWTAAIFMFFLFLLLIGYIVTACIFGDKYIGYFVGMAFFVFLIGMIIAFDMGLDKFSLQDLAQDKKREEIENDENILNGYDFAKVLETLPVPHMKELPLPCTCLDPNDLGNLDDREPELVRVHVEKISKDDNEPVPPQGAWNPYDWLPQGTRACGPCVKQLAIDDSKRTRQSRHCHAPRQVDTNRDLNICADETTLSPWRKRVSMLQKKWQGPCGKTTSPVSFDPRMFDRIHKKTCKSPSKVPSMPFTNQQYQNYDRNLDARESKTFDRVRKKTRKSPCQAPPMPFTNQQYQNNDSNLDDRESRLVRVHLERISEDDNEREPSQGDWKKDWLSHCDNGHVDPPVDTDRQVTAVDDSSEEDTSVDDTSLSHYPILSKLLNYPTDTFESSGNMESKREQKKSRAYYVEPRIPSAEVLT